MQASLLFSEIVDWVHIICIFIQVTAVQSFKTAVILQFVTYKNLYTKQSLKTEKECLEFLSKLNAPKLSESDRSICEGKLTLNECWLALSSMKNGKSPR